MARSDVWLLAVTAITCSMVHGMQIIFFVCTCLWSIRVEIPKILLKQPLKLLLSGTKHQNSTKKHLKFMFLKTFPKQTVH